MNMKELTTAFLLMVFTTCFAQAQETLPFFPFNNGIADDTYNTPEKQVKLLLDNGYKGTEINGLDSFYELYPELQKHGLKIRTIYFKVDLDKPSQPYDPRFEEVLSQLQGSETMFWLHVQSKNHASSSPEADPVAIPILQRMADLAQRYGIKLMLYPHRWFWVETADDAIRVAEQVNRRNLGMAFNLCHYLSFEEEKGRGAWDRLPQLAEASMPYLFAISLNGADFPAVDAKKPWNSYILPLGDGNFDTYRFLKTFTDLGFEGPVGLQCYNILTDKAEHLRQSMDTWQKFMGRMEEE